MAAGRFRQAENPRSQHDRVDCWENVSTDHFSTVRSKVPLDKPLSMIEGLGIELIDEETWREAVLNYDPDPNDPPAVDIRKVFPFIRGQDGYTISMAIGVHDRGDYYVPVIQIVQQDGSLARIGLPKTGEQISPRQLEELNTILSLVIYFLELHSSKPSSMLGDFESSEWIREETLNSETGIGGVVTSTATAYNEFRSEFPEGAAPYILRLSTDN